MQNRLPSVSSSTIGTAHGSGVRPGAAGLLRADAPVHRGTHAAPGPADRRPARRQVRAGRAAATVNVEPAGFGGIESQLATDGTTAFAAVNALTFIYRARFWDRRFCA